MKTAEEKGRLAKELFESGYNCAQSVVLAYAEEMGLSRRDAAKISSAFGGGMGRMREVCGAVSGAFMVMGTVSGYFSPDDKQGKKDLYERVQAFAADFRRDNGSIICAELLRTKKNADPVPAERTVGYYAARPCAELVRYAAELVHNYL